ncbi:bifunctional fructose-bisphosphatase/inositol-phosphate phosphatase [Methanobacterium movens]|nr:MAG: inositol monophosphatase [Methanobacterium sp.]
MDESESIFWRNVALKITQQVEKAINQLIGKKEAGEIIKMGADGTPTKLIDLVAENEVISVLEGVSRQVLLISEEIGELEIGNKIEPVPGENKIINPDSKIVFVVDPLDGTSNAIKNIPAFGISIAVAEYSSKNDSAHLNDIQMGFVKNFATGDFFEALKGKGAFLNGEKIHPSSLSELSSSCLGIFIYGNSLDMINNLSQQIRRMRIMGSVAIELCYVANGAYDAFVDIRNNLRVIDIAASQLIISESGGKVSDTEGIPLNSLLKINERTSIVAAGNNKLHDELIKTMEVI